MLRYRATVLQAFKDMGRFTVNEMVLSSKDVLVLLHKWSLIERNTKLQEDLRAAIEKHQVRDLMSECQHPQRLPSCFGSTRATSVPPIPSSVSKASRPRAGWETWGEDLTLLLNGFCL